MKKSLSHVLLSLLALSSVLYGNGGGYHHGVKLTGTVAPFTAEGTENVQIMDEKLDVVLAGKSAKVSVLYKMRNVTTKKVKVKFGFPVEDVVNSWLDVVHPDGDKSDLTPKYTKNYRVMFNGKLIKHKYQHEPFGADGDKNLAPFKGSEVLKGIKGWQVSEIKLKPGEVITLQIIYDSQYDEENYSISDDFSQGPWLFHYRLSTGAVWHGPIVKGKVTISYTNQLLPQEVRIDKPVNRFKKVGQQFIWEFENLEPTLADDITVQAIAQESEYSFYSEKDDERAVNQSYIKLDKKWFLKQVKYSVTASSTLADENNISYKVQNLKHRWNDVWSEGAAGSGIGETLTFKLDKPTVLSAISLQNGHFKSDRLFALNNRVRQLEVLINGTEKRLITVADMPVEKRYDLDYSKPISSLKLTIKSVYKGSKYDDTCISSFSLIEPLKKEPKSYGAR